MAKPTLLLLHRLYYLYSGAKTSDALNNPSPSEISASNTVAFELKQAINALKSDAFDETTGTVNYTHLKNSVAYRSYRQITQKLHHFDLTTLRTREEKLAFWINLYNALIVDAVIHFGIQKTVQEVKGFFVRAAYIVNGYRFSADDIEHGILRANAGHVAIPGPQFGGGDPRRAFALKNCDARIHFALVCASQSCPPIAVYTPEKIDDQLDLAAKNFVNSGGVTVDISHQTVNLSKIFQWYGPDFGGKTINQFGLGNYSEVLGYIAQFISDKSSKDALWEKADKFKVQFVPYNWGLNLVALE